MLAEKPKAGHVGLEFLTGEPKRSHDPSGIVFAVLVAMSGVEREYIRDRTLEGHKHPSLGGDEPGEYLTMAGAAQINRTAVVAEARTTPSTSIRMPHPPF